MYVAVSNLFKISKLSFRYERQPKDVHYTQILNVIIFIDNGHYGRGKLWRFRR